MSSPPISSSPTAVDPETDVSLKSDPKPEPDVDTVPEPELDAEPAHVDPPDHSKREYLLAQIRQKDAIIESLLKQVSACKSVGFLLLSHVLPWPSSSSCFPAPVASVSGFPRRHSHG